MHQVLYFMPIFKLFGNSEESLWHIVEEGGFLWKETFSTVPSPPLPTPKTIDLFFLPDCLDHLWVNLASHSVGG